MSILVPGGFLLENRKYIPMGFVDENTIISDSAYAIYDVDVWVFSLT
ncbi:MAG: type IIL restriction-modification enzyme MmeI [Streptococcus salivarius]